MRPDRGESQAAVSGDAMSEKGTWSLRRGWGTGVMKRGRMQAGMWCGKVVSCRRAVGWHRTSPMALHLALTCLLAVASPGLASPVYVDKDAPGPTQDGTRWATAYRELSAALASDSTGTAEFWVAGGTYLPGGTANTFFDLKGRRLLGGFAGTESAPGERPADKTLYPTILSGDLGGGLHLTNSILRKTSAGVAELDRLTLRDAALNVSVGAFGGALWHAQGSIRVSDCRFVHNQVAASGGAVYIGGPSAPDAVFSGTDFIGNASGSGTFGVGGAIYVAGIAGAVTLQNCNFVSNICNGATSAGLGGADLHVYDYTAPVVVSNCTFTASSSPGGGRGGAIALRKSSAVGPSLFEVTGCEFRACTSFGQGQGGALYAEGALSFNQASRVALDVAIRRSRFLDGFSASGGAVALATRDAVLENCVFAGNRARQSGTGGGGILIADGNARITYCTFYSNRVDAAAGSGGAIYRPAGGTALVPLITVVNSIFYGDDVAAGGSGKTLFVTAGTASISYTLVDPSSASLGPPGSIALDGATCINGDPMFLDPAAYVYALLVRSPARNIGQVLPSVPGDILMYPRSGTPTLGAYEAPGVRILSTGWVLSIR